MATAVAISCAASGSRSWSESFDHTAPVVTVTSMGTRRPWMSGGSLDRSSERSTVGDVTLLIAQLDVNAGETRWEPEARRALEHFVSAGVDGIVLSTPVRRVEGLLDTWDEHTPVLVVSEVPGLTQRWGITRLRSACRRHSISSTLGIDR